MIPVGYQARLIGTANSVDELNMFVPLEERLPEPSRVLLQVAVTPDADIQSLAEELNAKCLEKGVPPWPEYPGTIAFAQDNTLYLAWTKGIAWLPIIIGLLIVIPFIAPIILYFVSPGFKEVIDSVIMLLVLGVMMLFMTNMTRTMIGPPKPREKLPPFSERMKARLAKIETDIAALRAGIVGIEDVITETALLVKEVPRVAITPAEKERLSRQAARVESEAERKLREYEVTLTPGQKGKLEEERRLIREIRETWES